MVKPPTTWTQPLSLATSNLQPPSAKFTSPLVEKKNPVSPSVNYHGESLEMHFTHDTCHMINTTQPIQASIYSSIVIIQNWAKTKKNSPTTHEFVSPQSKDHPPHELASMQDPISAIGTVRYRYGRRDCSPKTRIEGINILYMRKKIQIR